MHGVGGKTVKIIRPFCRFILHNFSSKSSCKIMHFKNQPSDAEEFVCLLGFNARAAIFQLYSGDEHKVDDK